QRESQSCSVPCIHRVPSCVSHPFPSPFFPSLLDFPSAVSYSHSSQSSSSSRTWPASPSSPSSASTAALPWESLLLPRHSLS
ncbi:hypothetical protein PMAYCL1PPCAC_02937, partial [Pristionchus mayeri]